MNSFTYLRLEASMIAPLTRGRKELQLEVECIPTHVEDDVVVEEIKGERDYIFKSLIPSKRYKRKVLYSISNRDVYNVAK